MWVLTKKMKIVFIFLNSSCSSHTFYNNSRLIYFGHKCLNRNFYLTGCMNYLSISVCCSFRYWYVVVLLKWNGKILVKWLWSSSGDVFSIMYSCKTADPEITWRSAGHSFIHTETRRNRRDSYLNCDFCGLLFTDISPYCGFDLSVTIYFD